MVQLQHATGGVRLLGSTLPVNSTPSPVSKHTTQPAPHCHSGGSPPGWCTQQTISACDRLPVRSSQTHANQAAAARLRLVAVACPEGHCRDKKITQDSTHAQMGFCAAQVDFAPLYQPMASRPCGPTWAHSSRRWSHFWQNTLYRSYEAAACAAPDAVKVHATCCCCSCQQPLPLPLHRLSKCRPAGLLLSRGVGIISSCAASAAADMTCKANGAGALGSDRLSDRRPPSVLLLLV